MQKGLVAGWMPCEKDSPVLRERGMMEDKNASENKEKTEEWYRQHGYDMYPERRRAKKDFLVVGGGLQNKFRVKNKAMCELNVVSAVKENPLVKLLIQALKKAGCPVKIRRNIVCEECESVVTGGYDQELNQIVICDNKWKSRKFPDVTLVHELVHMYDYCVGEVDFSNLEHLACTEIRAANLAHCSFISSLLMAQSSFINVKKTHQYCVKMKAAQSMSLARNITVEQALDIIGKVFDKCYNDLEPIGRRIRRNSLDPFLAYNEAVHLGFCE